MQKIKTREAMIKAAREEIEKILAWDESHPEMRFSEMEDQILEARKKIGERMIEEWMILRESERKSEIPENKKTGKRMHPKGKKKVKCRVGEIEYAREYYYDKQERKGYYPLDEKLDINSGEGISEGVKHALIKLAARLPYEESTEIYAELTGVKVATSSLWTSLQGLGERVLQMECANKLNLKVEQVERITAEKDAGVSMDGLFVNVRDEGWKELKVGCVFTFCAKGGLKANKEGVLIEDVKANSQTYVSHLGGPEGIGMKVDRETQHRNWSRARQHAVVGDGASWIWKQAEFYFPDSAHIVDWYHAKQHLSAAADNLYANHPGKKEVWLETASKNLYNGQAKIIARQLRKGPCPQDAGYFEENHERMQYRDFQSAALPIGSGTIEAAAKMYQSRLAGTGMRWSRNGLQHILPFRDSILSSRFDALWNLLCP